MFILDVEASCTIVGTISTRICQSMLRKKCCINISMINVGWQIFVLGSTFTIPIIILVEEVVHLINSLYNCLNKVYAQSIAFPFIAIIIDMPFLLLK